MRFSKWHGLGNSYLLTEQAELSPEQATTLAREYATDGVLQVVARTDNSADVVIWNPDGSTAEMSGNGTRIAARWLALQTGARNVTIRTGAGREVRAHMLAPPLVETDLGGFTVAPPETVDGVELTPVSVGNPHAVVRGDPGDAKALGPRLETHDRFPDRTNVQLVRVDGPHDITIGIWERGAGATSASGSSAAAAAAAAVAREWCESPVTVHMEGGELIVRLENGRAIVVGPAEHVDDF
jgi:diaminopimelate epimerase